MGAVVGTARMPWVIPGAAVFGVMGFVAGWKVLREHGLPIMPVFPIWLPPLNDSGLTLSLSSALGSQSRRTMSVLKWITELPVACSDF